MTNCALCSKEIPDKDVFTHPTDGAKLHGTCAELYNPAAEKKSTSAAASATPPQGKPGDLSCQQCGGEMKKTKKAEKNMALQLLGVLLFFVGLALLFYIPIGTIVGLIVMVVAARLGYSKKKVWLCKSCGYFFERA